MQHTFDVAIVGGGPAATACAIKLRRESNVSVALFERNCYNVPKFGETLPAEMRTVLEPLGHWQQFLRDDHIPSPGILVAWGSDQLTEKENITNSYGSGWHIDRLRFERSLADAACRAGANLYLGTLVRTCIRLSDGSWKIQLEGRYAIDVICRLLVIAAGRSGCRFPDLGRRQTGDRLIAAIGIFSGSKTFDRRTLIEACESGWWYSALLPHDKQIIALMTDGDLVGSSDPQSIARLWNQSLGKTLFIKGRAEGANLVDGIRLVPCSTTWRNRTAGDGWLAIGDAAYTLDPLSGQGIYKAFLESNSASSAVGAHFSGARMPFYQYELGSRIAIANSLRSQQEFYLAEQRWPGAPFWKRRHGTAARNSASLMNELPDFSSVDASLKHYRTRFGAN